MPLTWKVLSYPMGRTYTFDGSLIPKLSAVVGQYAGGRPALVFCNSRKISQQAAAAVAQAAARGGLVRDPAQRDALTRAAARLRDRQLAEMVKVSVAPPPPLVLPTEP